MLNKDQYNQDDYNDYYAQATEGAEIRYGREEGGGKKMIVIFLLLLLIAGLGYFGWKNFASSESTNSSQKVSESSSEPQTVAEATTPIETSTTPPATKTEPTADEKTAQQVVKSIASTQSGSKSQMSAEDMAKIVKMVTEQMKLQSRSQERQKVATTTSTQDDLEASLSQSDVDTLSSETISEEKLNKSDSSKQASIDEKTNTYNKVILTDKDGSLNDDLSKLSDEISNVINTVDTTTDTTGYTQSLSTEVETRVKEMRYVTVKKGDTLGKIAKRIYGNVMDYKKIYEANPDILRRADRIYIGQRLRVPE